MLIEALVLSGVDGLRVVSNNFGVDDWGPGPLLSQHRIARVTASYVGEDREFERQFLASELEVELTPQGSRDEWLRAGGAGIPATVTLGGVGTPIAEGDIPLRFAGDGTVVIAFAPKEVREFGGREYVLEEAIVTDFALVWASVGGRHGNPDFDSATGNFNPLVAPAGHVKIAMMEHTAQGVTEDTVRAVTQATLLSS